MSDLKFSDNNNSKMIIEAFGKSCKLFPCLSMHDLEIVSQWSKEKTLSNDYRAIVAEIISNHTNNIFSVEEILKLDTSVFREYIRICVVSDEKLQKNYLEESDSDIYKKFVNAIKRTERDYNNLISESFKNILTSTLQRGETPKMELKEIAISKEKIQDITSSVTSMIQLNDIISSINFAWLDNIKKILTPQKLVFPDYSKFFSSLASTIQELWNNIRIPTISDEDKGQLIEAYTMWGELGWTLPPKANRNAFSQMPLNSMDAYNQLRYCTTDTCLKEIF